MVGTDICSNGYKYAVTQYFDLSGAVLEDQPNQIYLAFQCDISCETTTSATTQSDEAVPTQSVEAVPTSKENSPDIITSQPAPVETEKSSNVLSTTTKVENQPETTQEPDLLTIALWDAIGNLDANITCEWMNWTNWEACVPEEEYCSLLDEEPNKWSRKRNATYCKCDSNDINGNATLKEIACGLGGYHLESCDNKPIHECQAYYGYEWVNSTGWSICHNSSVDQKCGLDQQGYQVEFLQVCDGDKQDSCDYQPYQVQDCPLFCPEHCHWNNTSWGDWEDCMVKNEAGQDEPCKHSKACGFGFQVKQSNECLCGVGEVRQVTADLCQTYSPPIHIKTEYKICKDICETAERRMFTEWEEGGILRLDFSEPSTSKQNVLQFVNAVQNVIPDIDGQLGTLETVNTISLNRTADDKIGFFEQHLGKLNAIYRMIKNEQTLKSMLEPYVKINFTQLKAAIKDLMANETHMLSKFASQFSEPMTFPVQYAKDNNSCFQATNVSYKRASFQTIYEIQPPVFANYVKMPLPTNEYTLYFVGCTLPEWNGWGAYGECVGSNCDFYGVRNRTRSCENQKCYGFDTSYENCEMPCYEYSKWNKTAVRNATNNQVFTYERKCYNVTLQHPDNECSNETHLELKKLFNKIVVKDKCFMKTSEIESSHCEGDDKMSLEVTHWSNWTNCINLNKTKERSCKGDHCDLLEDNEGEDKISMSQPCTSTSGGFVWSDWKDVGVCSVSCGGANITQTRECLDGDCEGDTEQSVYCNLNNCPQNGNWSEWTIWTDCNVTCGDGTKIRRRTCDEPRTAYGGIPCEGLDEMKENCSQPLRCPVVVAVNKRCDDACKSYNLSCSSHYDKISLKNLNGGRFEATSDSPRRKWSEKYHPSCFAGNNTCEGYQEVMKQTFECNVDPPEGVFRICNCIPQDEVGFGEWEEWSVCSENCGFGTRRRSRDCDDETNCSENEKKEDVGECIRERCPIHGKLSEWGPWQRCNATCGPYGVSIRKRECIDPLYGGLNCSALGPLEEKQNCNDDKFCIVKGGWTPWSKWGLCDPICNPMKSIKKRTRKCENPKPEFTNEDCKGSSVQEQKCTEAEECTRKPSFPDYCF